MVLLELAGALATKKIGNIFLVNILQQLLEGFATNYLNLFSGFLVEPVLDDAPDGCESPWGVDDAELAKLLWIIILGYFGCFLDEIVNFAVHLAD